MRAVIQRVTSASVTVEGKVVGSIEKGLLILLGAGKEDTKQNVEEIFKKIKQLRIFPDDNGKMNLSIKEIEGQVLIVSQFTLYANCQRGNRPSFTEAAPPEEAKKLYEYFIQLCKEENFSKVETGIFGADMKVSLVNDGPVTVILEK